MSHVIELELPESVHEILARKATNSGLSTEVLVLKLLTEAAKEFNDDPIERFIGAFDSHGSDWADQHDKYIGQAVIETSRSKDSNR